MLGTKMQWKNKWVRLVPIPLVKPNKTAVYYRMTGLVPTLNVEDID